MLTEINNNSVFVAGAPYITLDGSCMCIWSTAGCQTNSDCCAGLQCNVYNYWSQCVGKSSIESSNDIV